MRPRHKDPGAKKPETFTRAELLAELAASNADAYPTRESDETDAWQFCEELLRAQHLSISVHAARKRLQAHEREDGPLPRLTSRMVYDSVRRRVMRVWRAVPVPTQAAKPQSAACAQLALGRRHGKGHGE